MALKKYTLSGQELGEVALNESLAQAESHSQSIKDYIVAIRANARQWSASTQGRSEVNHSTQKPHPQKKTGRARQGRLSSPQYKGGGVVFGPKPKFDQHVRINKKEKRAAIRHLLAEKINAGKVTLIDSTEMQAPKTKTLADFLKNRSIERSVLFIGEGAVYTLETEEGVYSTSMPTPNHDHFIKSVRNLPRAKFSLAKNINGYLLMCAQDIVMTESAYQEIQQWLA